MSEFFTVKKDHDVATIIFDRKDKDMNILSEVVLRAFNDVLDDLIADRAINGFIFMSGKTDQFIVGADITEIQSLTTVEKATEGAAMMQAFFQKVHTCGKISVAAINGTCLGGGLEFSLACTWRVVTDNRKTKIGLPEIQLGLIPGAGGTQRLPRLVGIQAGLDMILTAKQVDGTRALKMGLADACVPASSLEKIAREYATKKRTYGMTPAVSGQWQRRLLEGNALGRKIMAKKAKEMIDDKTKGFYPASYKALDAVFDGYDLSLEDGLALEAKLFGQLSATREHKSLTHLFHAITAIKKHPYKDAGREIFGTEKTKLIGMVGGGFMGAGIATLSADKGIRVRLSDPSKESLGKALKHARDYFQKKVQRRRLKPFEMDQKLAHISPDLSPTGFESCDIVIEAVFEDLNLKQKILKGLEAQNTHKNWIFASNTSAIPISKIAAVSKAPERICGMHFFSPVEKMPLLEIVATDKTAPWALARAIEVGQTLGKQVIVVKDSPGFYTTRALAFFLAEASLLLTEGYAIEAIDKALMDVGFPVGPITLIDEVGIDVGSHVLETIFEAFPSRLVTPKEMKVILDSGRLGRKNGKGFYIYEDGKKKGPDQSIYSLVGLTPKQPNAADVQDIVDRCLYVFVAESVRCLEEGILASPFDGDVGAVFGLGFPPFQGGPFKFVDHEGAKKVKERLADLANRHGERFRAPQKILDMAQDSSRFFPEEPLTYPV